MTQTNERITPLSQRSYPTYQDFEDVCFEKRVWIPSASISNYVMMFTRLYIGGKTSLGRRSFKDLIITLSESALVPRVLVFWTNSVKACLEGSPLLDAIHKIEKTGTRVLVHGYALDKLQLKSKLRAGKLANNFDLLEAINKAQKVVTF